MNITLTANQLSMRFKARVLFHIPQICIGPNDAIYLCGKNGVGKTTLLKILAGLQTPTSGNIAGSNNSWLDKIWQKRGRDNVIYLHQSPYLFDGSVYQNVAYGIRFQKITATEKRTQVIAALRMIGLETLADEHISVLSGGEKQRVAMARAWILKPSILLMDEPSASLDTESINRLVIMAKDLLKCGSSIIITSHQHNPLTQLCTKQWKITETTLIESPLLHVVPKDSHLGNSTEFSTAPLNNKQENNYDQSHSN